MDGMIVIRKEKGYTSHDVVAKLRGILHMKKIGHTGTLDPDAEGVLPVALGKATRLVDLITDKEKTYEAVMRLGVVTDTQDMSGTVLSQVSELNITEEELRTVIASFVGDYMQVPPMYSALKVNGKKLYELAREGIEVERKARRVHIYSIHINEMNLEDEEKTVTFTVECSKGTYIRTLCDDIGQKLGCGACMMKLTRTRVGSFAIDESLTLNQISALCLKGDFDAKVIAVDEMFPDYRKITVTEENNKLIYNGNKFGPDAVKESENMEYVDTESFRVYDENAEFIGIYRYEGNVFAPVKMFYSGSQPETKGMES